MGSPPTMFPVFYCALFVAASYADPVIFSHGEDNVKGNCPSGWMDATYVGMGCLRFDTTKSYTWDKANGFCRTIDGYLVEIRSEEQMEFVRNLLDVLGDNEGVVHWWTSGTDAGLEGRWNWAVSLERVGSYTWYNQPTEDEDRNCQALVKGYNYKGDDYGCSNSFYAICQKK